MDVNLYYLIIFFLLAAFSITLYFFFHKNENLKELKSRFANVISVEEEVIRLNHFSADLTRTCDELNKKYKHALVVYKALEDEIDIYKDTVEAYEYGLYQPQFNFDTPQEYKDQLLEIYKKQRNAIKNDSAILCTTQWTVNGKTSEGNRMTNKYKKLMLFAFNGECDSLISKVKWHNVIQTRQKIIKAFDNINKLGSTHNISIRAEYLSLKLEELTLAYEYDRKKYEEKEEQRRIREELREEEKARMEYEIAKRKADEEEKRYQKALNQALSDLGRVDQSKVDELNVKISLLEQKLREAQENKERAISMAQLTKAGHIYIISNIGSFGEGVFKIGMTRRLEPMDRIRELGDASVPFRFDVHAIIFSEDAPRLEYEIHKAFAGKRVNMTNHRREFFKVSLEEIKDHIHTNLKADAEFLEIPEAREFRETLSLIENFKNERVKDESESLSFPESLFDEDIVEREL